MAYLCAIVDKRADGRGNPAPGRDPAALAQTAVRAGMRGLGLSAEPVSAASGPVAAAIADPLLGDAGRGLFEDAALLAVCDGEFYNAAELASRAGVPAEAGEAALLAGLFRKQGQDWWRAARGTFGAFVWDKAAARGWAWCDRLGVRPLMIYEDAARIAVATRIASLAALPGFQGDMRNQALFSYLLMEMIPTPFTVYKSVRKLESGHKVSIADGKAETAMYWNMRYPERKLSDPAEMEEGIRARMRGAVRGQASLRVGSPEEIGSFLSGGTDSSLVAGLVSELHPGRAKTFSIGFAEEGYDEMGFARIAAGRFHTRSDEYYVTRDDIVEALPRIVAAFDEPFANSSVVPTYFCAKRARETGVKVMLGGDGGDEIFGGNSRYVDNFRNFSRYPLPVEIAMRAAVGLTPAPWRKGPIRKVANYLARKRAPLHERIHAYDLGYYLGDVNAIFAKAFLDEGPFVKPQEVAARILAGAEASDEIDRYMYHDLKNTLADNDLRKVNTMTELAGVQVRYPFLDHEMVEYTGLIPAGLKVKDGALRWLYKEAFKDILPQEIIHKKKHGFGLPVVRWMMRPGRLHDMVKDALFDGRLSRRGIFRAGFVDDLYKRAQADKTTYFGSYLYYIFFMELWMREHLDRDPAREAGSGAVPAAIAGRA